MNEFIKNKAIEYLGLAGYFIKPLVAKKNDTDLYIELYGKDSVEARRFYNISAGGHFDFGCGIHHPCWTNIDMYRNWKSAKCYDPSKDVALKKDAIFRVHTINTDIDYRALKNNDREYFFWFQNSPSISLEQAFLEHFAASASTLTPEGAKNLNSDEELRSVFSSLPYEDALNYCTARCPVELQNKYRNRHINWWNPNKLHKMRSIAGFKTIYLSAPEQSASPVLRNDFYFDNMCNRVMLYMEAVNN